MGSFHRWLGREVTEGKWGGEGRGNWVLLLSGGLMCLGRGFGMAGLVDGAFE